MGEGAELATPKHTFFLDNDYFKLVVFKKQKTQEEPVSSPYLPKEIQEGGHHLSSV